MNDAKEIRKALVRALKLFEKAYEIELPLEIQAYIGAEMGAGKVSQSYLEGGATAFPKSEETWSSGSRLKLKSGRLLQSFNPKSPDSLSGMTGSYKNKLKYNIGSGLIYAGIQESGGFIKSKGRMHKYFWAMYAKYNNPFHKIMALSVKKKGGVNIKARPYFNPAIDKFFSKRYIDFVKEKFFESLREVKF